MRVENFRTPTGHGPCLDHAPAPAGSNRESQSLGSQDRTGPSLYYPQVYANANTVAGLGRSNPRFLIEGGLLQENQTAFDGGVIANQRIYDFGYTQNLVESNQFNHGWRSL